MPVSYSTHTTRRFQVQIDGKVRAAEPGTPPKTGSPSHWHAPTGRQALALKRSMLSKLGEKRRWAHRTSDVDDKAQTSCFPRSGFSGGNVGRAADLQKMRVCGTPLEHHFLFAYSMRSRSALESLRPKSPVTGSLE